MRLWSMPHLMMLKFPTFCLTGKHRRLIFSIILFTLLTYVNRYGRVFHPQINLHALIANLVIWEMTDKNMQNHGGDAVPEIFTPTATVCEYTPRRTNNPCTKDDDCSSPNCFGAGVSYQCVQGSCSCQGRSAPTITTAAPTTSWAVTLDACYSSAITRYPLGFGNWCSAYTTAPLATQPCTAVPAIGGMTACFSATQSMYTVPSQEIMEKACVSDSHQYTQAWQYLSSACYAASEFFAANAAATGNPT